MPQIPEATDWYIVVPLPREATISPEGKGFWGSAQVFVVNTNDMDVAAKMAHDAGYARCVIILGTHYFDPTVPDPPPYIPEGGP